MNKIRYPQPVDLKPFGRDNAKPEALYGLPSKVAYCKSCVISNQRPNSAVEYKHTKQTKKDTINFNEDGICDACSFTERKRKAIDWADREKQLVDLCDKHRKKDGSYDCIVPGSGGKDSFYASHILKTKYGMHPLTVTWAPHVYTEWGWKNFQSWIHAGYDNYLMTPNGRVHRLLTRLSTELLFHPFQAFMFGQKSLAPKMALLFNIPLVFYGENEAEYGNPISDSDKAKRDWSYFTSDDPSKIYLGGVSVADLKSQFGVDQNDLQPYLPADPNRIAEQKTEVHYLGYYLKWHHQACYYYSVEHGGFQASPERTPGTYSKYNSIDDRIDDLHYFTTGIKFGIGRATYKDRQSGTSGETGVFSFNGNKIITTSESGMLVVSSAEKIERGKFLATQARDKAPYYQYSSMGYNYQMSNILAGVGRGQLRVLPERVAARRNVFEIYRKELSGHPASEWMPEATYGKSTRWLSAFVIKPKATRVTAEHLVRHLDDDGIEARRVWKPLHLQPLYQGTTCVNHDERGKVAEEIFERGVCLPSGSNMTLEQQQRIVRCLQSVLSASSV